MPTATPPDMMKPAPRTICMVARVAMRALMPSLAITAPLKRPMSRQARRLIATGTAICPGIHAISTALRMPPKATTAPMERSKSPAARQKSMVQASIPTWETERERPIRFCTEKK